MDIQNLNNGRKVVNYGSPVEYQSPLMIDTNLPNVVTYKCGQTQVMVGKVYKTQDGRWWLASCFVKHWTPLEVFTKIEGFLLLNRLYKIHQENNEH